MGIDGLKQKADKALVSDIPVKSFMLNQVFTVQHGSKIHSTIKMLVTQKISGAPVVDNSNHLVGIVTEHDLLIQAATKDVAAPMDYTKDVHTVTPDTPLKEVLVTFYKNKHRLIPVVDPKTKKVVGLVTRMMLLNKLMGF